MMTDGAQPVVTAIAVVVELANLSGADARDIEAVAALGLGPPAEHDRLPLGPVGSDPASVTAVGEDVCTLVGYGLSDELPRILGEQERVEADLGQLARAEPGLTGGAPAQVEADLGPRWVDAQWSGPVLEQFEGPLEDLGL
jgi:hypothetical protein